MAEDSLVITYETLYEVLRAEKNKEELCELDSGFYANVLEYLSEKTRILQEASSKSDIFSIDEKDNTQVQLQNIRKIIREIYERREKKIIDMALNKSRTNSDIIDTGNLLSSERKFFSTVRELLDKFRLGILAQVLSLKEPELDIECSMQMDEKQVIIGPELTPEQEAEITVESKEQTEAVEADAKKEATPVEAEQTPEQAKSEEQKSVKKIKITQAIEQFVGSELEMYGPYNEDDVAEVPSEIAEILIGKGSAVEEE